MDNTKTESEIEIGRQGPNWVLITLVLSILYAVVVCYLLVHGTDQKPDCFGGRFPCLNVNEIGDLLAGVFAPLAFLWLVAAVLVQAQELKEQRKELKLTRNEFVQNREVAIETKDVAEAQAKAANAQAEAAITNAKAAETQNRILEEQLEAQRIDRRDSEFSALLDQVYNVFVGRIVGLVVFLNETSGEATFISDRGPSGRDAALAYYSMKTFAFLSRPGFVRGDFTRLRVVDFDVLMHAKSMLETIIEMEKSVSTSQQLLVQTIDVREWLLSFQELFEKSTIVER